MVNDFYVSFYLFLIDTNTNISSLFSKENGSGSDEDVAAVTISRSSLYSLKKRLVDGKLKYSCIKSLTTDEE